MIQALIIVLVALFMTGVLVQAWAWLGRQRAAKRLGDAPRLLEARGVSLRVVMSEMQAVAGMRSGRAHRTRGDLYVCAERLLIVGNRGVIVEIGPQLGLKLDSARSTGPGRLVIEGSVPRSDGRAGHYRIEVALPDAGAWVKALQAFVKPGERVFAESFDPKSKRPPGLAD